MKENFKAFLPIMTGSSDIIVSIGSSITKKLIDIGQLTIGIDLIVLYLMVLLVIQIPNL